MIKSVLAQAIRSLLDATIQFYMSKPDAFWASAFPNKQTGLPEYKSAAEFQANFTASAVKKWMRCSHVVALGLHRQRPGAKKRIPHWEEVCAVACAVHNLHLVATAARVGAYWSSWYTDFRESAECVRFITPP